MFVCVVSKLTQNTSTIHYDRTRYFHLVDHEREFLAIWKQHIFSPGFLNSDLVTRLLLAGTESVQKNMKHLKSVALSKLNTTGCEGWRSHKAAFV